MHHKQGGTLEEYRELPSWQRYLFYNVKLEGQWYSVPKAIELGVLANGMQRAVDELLRRGDNDWGGYLKTAVTAIAPADEKDVISVGGLGRSSRRPLIYSFSPDKPIVPGWEDKKALKLRDWEALGLGHAT